MMTDDKVRDAREWSQALPEDADRAVAWALIEEIEKLKQGLVESVASEDYNRGLRWEAEKAQVQAELDRREAMDLALVVWMTALVPGRQLDVLRLERKVERQQQQITALTRQLWLARHGDDDEPEE